jgi:hypothetical protein
VLAAKDGAERGLGLLVVERMAAAWGVRREGAGGKVVWCLLALPAATRVAAAAPPAPAGRAAGPGWHRQLPSAARQRPATKAPRDGTTPEPRPAAGSRDQLAASLLGELLQPLFGLGLQLQTIGGLTQEAEVCRRLEGAIDDLDTILHDLRGGLLNPTVDERHPLLIQRPPGGPPRSATASVPRAVQPGS